jgi:hypothetical protein
MDPPSYISTVDIAPLKLNYNSGMVFLKLNKTMAHKNTPKRLIQIHDAK